MGETRTKASPRGLDLTRMRDVCCMVGPGRPSPGLIGSTHGQLAVLGGHLLFKKIAIELLGGHFRPEI